MHQDYADYVFLFPGRTFSAQFLDSWIKSINYLLANNYSFRWFIDYVPVISFVRNRLLGYLDSPLGLNFPTKPFEGKLTCQKVVFIDNDIVWSVSDLEKLLLHDTEVVGGAYLTADAKTVAATKEFGRMSKEEIVGTDLIEVTTMGLGFAACKFSVLTQLSYPWFSVLDFPDGSRIAEDLYFFNKIKALGYKVYLDPTIKVGHIKSIVQY